MFQQNDSLLLDVVVSFSQIYRPWLVTCIKMWHIRISLLRMLHTFTEKFEETKWAIRSRKWKKDRQYNSQKTTRQTIHKAPHRHLEIFQHEPHQTLGMNSGTPEG